MDPISLALITAVGVGITGSVTDATKASLAAGYTALKKRVLEKSQHHRKVPQALSELEASPTSKARQAVLVEEVTAAQLGKDGELVAMAQALLQQAQQAPVGFQIIAQAQNSAVSYSGNATTWNIQGDQHTTHS